jgi:ubiquitin-like modifier-activating enzyme ATG7
LTYLAVAHSVSEIRLVSYRDTSDASSINRVAAVRLKSSGEVATGARPGVVGWEKNDKGKLGPRMADLAPLMDPRM